VVSQGDSDVANIILRRLTALSKVITTRFKDVMAPQNEAIRQIRLLRDQILGPIEEAKSGLNDRLMVWRREERERIAEAQRIADEKRRKREELEAAHKGPEHIPGPEPKIEEPEPLASRDTTKTRKSWEVEITDIWQVPNEYLVFNEPAIRANLRKAVSAAGKKDGEPDIEIPGVKIYQKEVGVYG